MIFLCPLNLRKVESKDGKGIRFYGKGIEMPTRITVEDASRALGLTPLSVRLLMQQGQLDIGYVIKTGQKRHTYLIYRELLERELSRYDTGAKGKDYRVAT